MKRKVITIVMSALCAVALSGCDSLGSTQTSTPAPAPNTPAQSTQSKITVTPPESSAPSTAFEFKPVENPSIKILSTSLSTDYSGADVLVVEYEWTNTKSYDTDFTIGYINHVFQNGVEHWGVVVGCDDEDSAEKKLADVQPGVTTKIKVAYPIVDKSDVTIYVADTFGDLQIYQTVDLGGADSTYTPPATLQETSIKVKEAKLSKTKNDEDILVVTYDIYNGEPEPISFTFEFADKAYQNGVECSPYVYDSDEIETSTHQDNFLPGVTYTVKAGYKLSDMSDVELIVTGLLDKPEYIHETIALQ